MQEAFDLMVALRRLIDFEEDAQEGYGDAAIALMGEGQIAYGAAVFKAGHSYGKRARVLRSELADLQLKYGRLDQP